MKNIWLSHTLNYPALPLHLSALLDDLIDQNGMGKTPITSTYTHGDTRWSGYDVPAEIKEWINTNITSEYNNVRLATITSTDSGLKDSKLDPHTDHTRVYNLYYHYKTGGANVTTTFWQEQGEDLVRPFQIKRPDVSKLIQVEQCLFVENTWSIIRTDVLHSVENIQSPRVNIQIDFLASDKVESIINNILKHKL